MNTMTVNASNVEQVIAGHVDMVFSVAMQLTGNGPSAERLARMTLHQALKAPDQLGAPHMAKRELLTMLRRNFLNTFAMGIGPLVAN